MRSKSKRRGRPSREERLYRRARALFDQVRPLLPEVEVNERNLMLAVEGLCRGPNDNRIFFRPKGMAIRPLLKTAPAAWKARYRCP